MDGKDIARQPAERLAMAEVERRRIRLRQRYSAGDLAAQADIQAIEELVRVLRPGGQVWDAAHDPVHLRATWAALGQPLAPGKAHPEPALTLTCPLTLTADDAQFLLGTYGQEVEVPDHLFPVQDAAQLLIWRHSPSL